jgi:SAM-dependent methyltransferase
MRLDLLNQLHCPYCGGAFHVSRKVAVNDRHLEWGLLQCRCFEFPVVDGVLMLSLSKAYGGAEEELQPYASLQIAAIQHLRRGDLDGLKAWMRRHLPLGMRLIEGGFETYLEFAAAYESTLDAAAQRFLVAASRDEVTGDVAGREHLRRRLGPLANSPRLLDAAMRLRLALQRRGGQPQDSGELLEGRLIVDSYYAQRFFSPRLAATHLNRRHLGTEGRVLSLCPGHGVFEFSLQLAQQKPETLVCMDAQFINLLVLKHLLNVDASLICHDLQFPYPFADGWFDGVFSSTCLPELPSQRHFVREAIRVTRPEGWTLFDSIWTLESGVKRIDPKRHYRFCQNFFEHIREYVPFFRECAGDSRRAAFDISGGAADYLGGPPWLHGAEADAQLERARDEVMSVLVTDPRSFRGYAPAGMPAWLSAETLSISPAYTAKLEGDSLVLNRKPEFAETRIYFTARRSGGLPARIELPRAELKNPARVRELYCQGAAAALPPRLMRKRQTLADLAG